MTTLHFDESHDGDMIISYLSFMVNIKVPYIEYVGEWLWVLYKMFETPLYEWFCNFKANHFKTSQKLQFLLENYNSTWV